MKKLYTILTMMMALLGISKASAQDLPTGVYDLGDEVTALETGKWYFLYNRGSQTYAKETSGSKLTQAASPKGFTVSGNEGYLVALEDAASGKFYIKTGLGNYFKAPSSSARGTGASPTSSWAIAIEEIADAPGHYLLKGSTYNMIAPSDGGDLRGGTAKTAGSIGDWAFIEVKTGTADELTGRDLYNYQMARLGFIRLKNKRSASYLTTTEAGSAEGATKATTGYSQIWLLAKSGVGYTLRSANTGQYLQENFAAPATASCQLYIQFSPNNTGTQAYINISSAQDFSGQTCLNLGQNGTTLYKWAYEGDAGCDWAIELAEDVTEEEVIAHVAGSNGYVGSLKNGRYYRLVSVSYDLVATEADGNVQSLKVNKENYSQYWQAISSGSGWALQNVVSQKYIQPQASMSTTYQVGTAKVALYPRRTNDKWAYNWVIPNESGGAVGMHTAATQGNSVVLWYTNADASVWAFEEVSLTDEEIETARGSQAEFNELVGNLATYQAHLDNLFEDKACTTLKSNIQALTDEQLAANADFAALDDNMKAMVLKVKNDTWQQFTNAKTGYTAGYEKFFRVADYKIYSNHQEMASRSNFEMSNSFGRLSGPTGIVANPGDIVYIYVDAEPKAECTLALETVGTDGVAGNHPTGNQTTLKKGLNVYRAGQQVLLYIFHQLNNTQKYLANYPDIKIHIEGGQLNGYWDATRGMTNADWALLQQDLLKAPYVNLKTERLVWQMDADLVLAAEPNEIEGLTRIWNTICANEDRYMGVEDFEGRYNNIWNVFSGASSYMHSTTYGTWYTESTISTVMNYANMRKAGNLWGPSHEIGHNHQMSINVIGTTESSNNLFSNINTFEQGIQTSRRHLPNDAFAELAKGTPWLGRDIWQTTGMFFQLYLYFHAQHHDDQFLPNLFRTMRKNPINKWSGTWATGQPTSYGKDDYLHLAKMICDVAQADLSEFFEAYGMFVPVSLYEVGDYSTYSVTTTQADIDAAKKYMQKYPKKLGNIMFIDDHVLPMKDIDKDNKFEGQSSSTKKSNNLEQSSAASIGDFGDYEDYDGRTEYAVSGDYFTVSGNTVTFKGTGCLGHKFYDQDGNLIWATSKKTATLPTAVRSLGVENCIVVAAEPNMTDVPCPYYKSGTSKVYKAQVYFGNEENNQTWWAGANTPLASYLPENAIGVVGSVDATDNITTTPNIINQDGTATSIVLNGDLPAYIPQDVTATSVTFKKATDGMAALSLPFDVTASDLSGLQTVGAYDGETVSLTGAESVEAGMPVVVSGNVNLNMGNTTVKAGDHQELSIVKILTSDGKGVKEVATASPFTYSFGEATGIAGVQSSAFKVQSSEAVYDLSGRRVEKVRKPGLYIVNGKKVMIK